MRWRRANDARSTAFNAACPRSDRITDASSSSAPLLAGPHSCSPSRTTRLRASTRVAIPFLCNRLVTPLWTMFLRPQPAGQRMATTDVSRTLSITHQHDGLAKEPPDVMVAIARQRRRHGRGGPPVVTAHSLHPHDEAAYFIEVEALTGLVPSRDLAHPPKRKVRRNVQPMTYSLTEIPRRSHTAAVQPIQELLTAPLINWWSTSHRSHHRIAHTLVCLAVGTQEPVMRDALDRLPEARGDLVVA